MFRTGYEMYVWDGLEKLANAGEIETEVRDAQTYNRKRVKAVISQASDKIPEGENLWLRSPLGVLLDENPWRIKILNEDDITYG